MRSEAEFLENLKSIHKDTRTIIISSHRMSVLGFVDRILLFDKGRLVADGPRDKVIALLTNKNPSPAAAPAQAPSRDVNERAR